MKTRAKSAIWDRPSPAKPTTKKLPIRRRSSIQATPHSTRIPALWQRLHASSPPISGLHTEHSITHTQHRMRAAQAEGVRRMDWKILLAYLTGTIEQELLLRNAYLVTGNRILRNQITWRM